METTMKLLIIIALLIACEGPTGPAGLKGEAGIDGVDGVANITVKFFSVLATQWNETNAKSFWYFRSFSEITTAVIDSGAVLVQVEGGTGEWWGLPQTLSFDLDDNFIVDFSAELTFIYTLGGLWISIENSTAVGTPNGLNFKTIIIPPA